MVTRTPVSCPVCYETVTPTECLEDHLVRDHTPRELAKVLVAEWEAQESGVAT